MTKKVAMAWKEVNADNDEFVLFPVKAATQLLSMMSLAMISNVVFSVDKMLQDTHHSFSQDTHHSFSQIPALLCSILSFHM